MSCSAVGVYVIHKHHLPVKHTRACAGAAARPITAPFTGRPPFLLRLLLLLLLLSSLLLSGAPQVLTLGYYCFLFGSVLPPAPGPEERRGPCRERRSSRPPSGSSSRLFELSSLRSQGRSPSSCPAPLRPLWGGEPPGGLWAPEREALLINTQAALSSTRRRKASRYRKEEDYLLLSNTIIYHIIIYVTYMIFMIFISFLSGLKPVCVLMNPK